MKEYPILFSPDMIRALLAGRKSVTRRISKQWLKVKAGDRLWCREAWGIGDGGGRLVDPTINYRAGGQLPLNKIRGTDSVWQHSYTTHCVLGTDLLKIRGGWIPSIHMFRWASRILLECEEDARAEPLWNITESECVREGFPIPEQIVNFGMSANRHFEYYWRDLHTKDREQ